VITIMIDKRGYESALSACPAPAAALAAAVPALPRPRAVLSGCRFLVTPVTQFKGTGLPVAGQFGATQRINDVPTMLFQPAPGDTARRPPI
jgi:hypothetical protein